MLDIDITRLCAQAMGYKGESLSTHWGGLPMFASEIGPYDPLHDDAQAMALVKKFNLALHPPCPDGKRKYHKEWIAEDTNTQLGDGSPDLNRAICECVAKLQSAKVTS